MQVIVKTLKGEMMEIEVEPSTTILELKQKIKEIKSFEVQSQKIVFKGKATQNQDTIDKLNIKDKDFLVVMAVVKKPQPKKEEEKKEEKKKQTESKGQNKQEKTEKKEQNKGQDPGQEEKLTNIMSMGFSREKSLQALTAANGDVSLAIEFVLNGIPEVRQQGNGSVANPLQTMLGGEEMQQLREMLINDPTSIGPLLQQLQQTHPELYDIISQDPEGFEEMILNGDAELEGEESMEPQEGAIVVSEEDDMAIQRLSNLGFSKIDAAQAFLACDKNEELAANLLFDRLANGDLDEGAFEQQGGQGGNGDNDDDNLFN